MPRGSPAEICVRIAPGDRVLGIEAPETPAIGDVMRLALEGAKGSVRAIDADLAQTNARSIASGEKLGEVYYRPPANYLEPQTLIRVLNNRLRAPAAV